jgi:hypothetical protein
MAAISESAPRRIGIDAIASPIHAPKANAIAERLIGTLRRECLDHIIVLNEQHLRSVRTEFVQYYNQGFASQQRCRAAFRPAPSLPGLGPLTAAAVVAPRPASASLNSPPWPVLRHAQRADPERCES